MSTATRHTSPLPKERSLLGRLGARLRREEADLPLLPRLLWALAGLILVGATVVLVGDLLGVLAESQVLGYAYQGLGASVALALLALATRGVHLSSSTSGGSPSEAVDSTDDRIDSRAGEPADFGDLFDTDAAILEAMEGRERVNDNRAEEAVAYDLAGSDEASLEKARRALRHQVTVTRQDLERLDGTMMDEALDDLEDGVPLATDAEVGIVPARLLAVVGRARYQARRSIVRWLRDLM